MIFCSLVGEVPNINPQISSVPNAFGNTNVRFPQNTPILQATASDKG